MDQKRTKEEYPSEAMPSGKGATVRKKASRVLASAKSMPLAFVQTTSAPYEKLAPEVRDQLVRELHTYPKKNHYIIRLVWIFFGILGGHRFAIGQIGTGLLMLITLGGAFIWWIIDGFRLREMVDTFNDEQANREANGLPPIGMEYVPVVEPEVLVDLPEWGKTRLKKGKPVLELIWDGVALAFFCYVLGAFTISTEYRTAVFATLSVLVMINFADFLIPFHHTSFIKSLIHWDYRLRLFYHFNPPGRRFCALFQAVDWIILCTVQKKARSEVLLYLEIGGVFFALKVMIGLMGGDIFDQIWSLDFDSFLSDWLRGVVLGFFAIYGFAAPIGAILMKHVLLRRPNYVRWVLSTVALFFLIKGLF